MTNIISGGGVGSILQAKGVINGNQANKPALPNGATPAFRQKLNRINTLIQIKKIELAPLITEFTAMQDKHIEIADWISLHQDIIRNLKSKIEELQAQANPPRSEIETTIKKLSDRYKRLYEYQAKLNYSLILPSTVRSDLKRIYTEISLLVIDKLKLYQSVGLNFDVDDIIDIAFLQEDLDDFRTNKTGRIITIEVEGLQYWILLDFNKIVDFAKDKTETGPNGGILINGYEILNQKQILQYTGDSPISDIGMGYYIVFLDGPVQLPITVSPFDIHPAQNFSKTIQDLSPPQIEMPEEDQGLIINVRKSGQPLLFTRNITLEEFANIVDEGELVIGPNQKNYFRSGLGHEYGSIVLIMKPGFLQFERKRQVKLKNLFLRKVDGEDAPGQELKELGKGTMIYIDNIVEDEAVDPFLLKLTRNVNFNRYLREKEFETDGKSELRMGRTIHMDDRERYMGLGPQFEDPHNVPLDQVSKILVPEHLWDTVYEKAKEKIVIVELLQKVEGTGKTEEEFLERADHLVRRSANYDGGKYDPKFGDNSFYLFEKAYFEHILVENSQSEEYLDTARSIFNLHGLPCLPGMHWIHGGEETIEREEEDWKIFVNPRQDTFFEVLDQTLEVLADVLDGNNIKFKIPRNLSETWRKGRQFKDSANPKIVIYTNKKILRPVMHALNAAFSNKLFLKAGFGEEPGPSFTNKFGESDLLFYKKEYWGKKEDLRSEIARRVEEKAKEKGITDFFKIRNAQIEALQKAGFSGINFYMAETDIDPLSD